MKMAVLIQRSIASVTGFQASNPEEALLVIKFSLKCTKKKKFEESQFSK